MGKGNKTNEEGRWLAGALHCRKEQNLQVPLRFFSHALDPIGFRV